MRGVKIVTPATRPPVVPPQFISITPQTLSMARTATETVYVFMGPAGVTNYDVTVSIDKPTLATVTFDGINVKDQGDKSAKVKIVGKAAGTAVVTVTTVLGAVTQTLALTLT